MELLGHHSVEVQEHRRPFRPGCVDFARCEEIVDVRPVRAGFQGDFSDHFRIGHGAGGLALERDVVFVHLGDDHRLIGVRRGNAGQERPGHGVIGHRMVHFVFGERG